jgi:hypothetical protein
MTAHSIFGNAIRLVATLAVGVLLATTTDAAFAHGSGNASTSVVTTGKAPMPTGNSQGRCKGVSCGNKAPTPVRKPPTKNCGGFGHYSRNCLY